MAAVNMSTLIACAIFVGAVALESVVSMAFLGRLKARHPQLWMHAEQPPRWQDRTLLSARSTMLYLLNRDYLGSLDEPGIRYCERYRVPMLVAYGVTVTAGIVAVVALAFGGW